MGEEGQESSEQPSTPLADSERAELKRLRAENAGPKMQVEFAKKSSDLVREKTSSDIRCHRGLGRLRGFPGRVHVPANHPVLQRRIELAQYTSAIFAEYCARNGVRRSLVRTGICYDNAVSESFFATYKKELVHTRSWPTIEHFKKETFDWIETYCAVRY